MMEKYLPNFRKAYPAYNDLSDDQLIIALRKKYPMYDDMDNSMFIGAIERRFSQKSSEDSPSMPSPLGINMLRPFGIDAMMAAVPQIIEHAPSLGRGAAKEVESTPQVAGRILQEAGETAELVPDNKFPDINMLNLLKEAVFQGNPLSAAIQAKEGKIPYSESLKIYNWGKNLTQDILMPGTRKMRAEVFKATDIDENVAEFGRKLAEDNQRYIENKYKPEETPLKQFLSDLGSGSVSLATALGVSLLTKSPNAAAIMFGVMGKARAYGEAREAGKDPLEASDISTMVGVGEGVLEYIGLDFMLKRFATPIKAFIIRTASEAMQEGLQTISERGIMTAAGVQEFKGLKPILKEAAYSALMGAILGGGASTIMSTIESRLNEKGVDSETSRKIAESIVQKASDRAVTLSEKIKNAKGKLINESDLQNISDQMSKGLITREELREKALKELSEASGLMKEIDEMTVKHVEVKEAQKEKFDQLVKEGKKQVKKAGLNKVKYATLTRRFGGLKIEGDLAGEVKLLPLYTKNKNGFTINEMAQKFIEAGYPVKSTRDLLDKLRNKEEFTLEEKGAEEAMEAEELEGREAEITAFEKYKPEDMPAGMIADKGVGTKFKIEGEEFEVKKNEPGDIIIEDGKRFEVDEFDKIPVDHGKLIAAKKGKEESDTSVLPKDVAQASKDKGLRYDGEASGIHYWTVPVTESGLVLKPSEMTGDILKVKLDKHYREWYKEKRELYMSGQIKEGTQEYEMLLKLGEILGQEELTKEKAPPEQIIKQTWEMTKAEFREYEDQRTKGAAENTRKAALHGPNLYFNQKLAIERALKEGREVPENVLAEWPRLSELAKESVVSDDVVNDYLKNKDIKQDDLLIASKQLNFELDKIEEVIDDEYKIGAEERIITGKGTKKDVEVTFNEKDLVSVLIPNIIKNPPDVAHFKGKIIKSAKDFANLLLPIRSVYFESLKVAYLDKNNRILDAQVVSVGNLGSSIVDPAEIVSLAPEGTKGVLVAHNHPSGSTTPSNEDIKINQVLRKAIFTGGYKYIDHVITDGDEFYSFQAEVSEKVGKYYQLAEEKFRSSIGMKLTSPDDFNKLTDLLRQGNNENNHIIFLNAQNKIMAIQRLKGEMEDISRSAIKNMRKYGSLGVLIDYPMGNVNDIQKLSFLLKDTNVNLLDVSSLENYSFAAQGLLREEVSKYGAKGKITKKEKIKSKVRKGIRPILKLVEPAKLAEWKHGAEVVARVIKAFHHSQAETIEFAERKSDVSDKTFGEVERYLRDHFSNEDLDRFMLTRGFPNTVEGVILQKEATQSISPEMRKLSKRILDVTQNAADLAYNKLLRYVEEISKSEGMTVEQMTEMNFLYVDEYFRGQYKNTEYYKNFQREIKKKIEQYIRNTKSFMKPKLFPTYADSKGVYGVELKNPNPITNIKSEIAAIERLRANHWLRDSLMDSGRDKYIMRETLKHIHPPKWKEIGPEGDIVWKDIWAEPELARLINNLLKLNLITSSKSGRFFWKMNNYLRAIKFLGSTFHQGSVTKQAFADNGWFGFMNPKRFMGTIGTALKISRKAHQKVLNDPVTKKAYRKYIQLGGTPIGHEGSFEYELAAIKQFEKLFDKLGILKATKTKAGKILLAGPKFPFSYVNWLFRWYIPQLKFQAYLKDIVRREKKLGKNLTDAELIETVKEGQNFYGEMNERLFGRSGTVTTLMRFIWMAPGYAEGNYRTNLKALFQWKKGGPGSRSRNNIVNSLLISSILATIGTLIFRGKGPDKPEKLEDVRDYFKIDTGMLDDKGEKIMIDLLTYDKDYWEIYGRLLFGEREKIPTSVIDRLGGMNSTLLEVATDIGLLMQGKALIDWKGDEIVHVTDPAMTKLLKYAMYEIDKVTPISLSVAQQARRRGVNDIVSYLQAVIGLRPTYTEQARRVKEQRRVISSYRDEREEIFRYLTTKRDPRKQIENYNKRIQVFIDNKFLSDEIRNTGKKLLIDLDMYIYRSVKRLRSTSTSSYDKQKIRKRLANLGIMPTDYARILMRKPYRRKKLKRIVK